MCGQHPRGQVTNPGASREQEQIPGSMNPFQNDDQRWQAVAARDKLADGAFYYSVATTGVYCRPGCAARLPRREHVRFHDSPTDAERAGFRACKRCRPNALSLAARQQELVAAACKLIDEARESIDLSSLSKSLDISPTHLHRLFKAATGLTPKAYAAARRMNRTTHELSQGNSVTAAIHHGGFQSAGRFYATSSSQLGMTPAKYRAGGKDAAIRFAIGPCWLGLVLVATTDIGVCAIALGNDADQLVRDLHERFSHAKIERGDRNFELLIAQVIGYIERPAAGLDLPLDIQGTAFQRRVWELLRNIPFGQTITYTELATRLGQPSAVRAVASACAANTIAVAIPCHRVIRTDGSLSGYRWGVERKAALLAHERELA